MRKRESKLRVGKLWQGAGAPSALVKAARLQITRCPRSCEASVSACKLSIWHVVFKPLACTSTSGSASATDGRGASKIVLDVPSSAEKRKWQPRLTTVPFRTFSTASTENCPLPNSKSLQATSRAAARAKSRFNSLFEAHCTAVFS
eukprot:2463581-Rhodomonas_salina.1